MWPLRFTAVITVPSLPNYSCREVYASVLAVPILAKRRMYVLYRSAATAQASVWRVAGTMDPALVWLSHYGWPPRPWSPQTCPCGACWAGRRLPTSGPDRGRPLALVKCTGHAVPAAHPAVGARRL